MSAPLPSLHAQAPEPQPLPISYDERALLFDCAGEPSVAIVSVPERPDGDTGLLIVVGGPQYRIGSHRQFVLLARHVAAHGIPALRFDYRGMGDSLAEPRDFERVEQDLRCALELFFREVPTLRRVVLWGLCDGASAICLHAPDDPRVAGRILVNPWVHTPQTQSATRLKHYYAKRIVSAEFWKRLLQGKVVWRSALAELIDTLRRRAGVALANDAGAREDAGVPLPTRMARGLAQGRKPVAVALSGDDRVAREFEDFALPSREWQSALREQLVELAHIAGANHTLASQEWQSRLQDLTLNWTRRMAGMAAAAAPRAH